MWAVLDLVEDSTACNFLVSFIPEKTRGGPPGRGGMRRRVMDGRIRLERPQDSSSNTVPFKCTTILRLCHFADMEELPFGDYLTLR